jgi:hypothetical protein
LTEDPPGRPGVRKLTAPIVACPSSENRAITRYSSRLARLAVLSLLLALSGCSLGNDDDEEVKVDAEFVVDLVRLGSDRTTGKVGLSNEPDGKTLVEIALMEPASGQRAEIRRGNCDVRSTDVTYTLPPLVAGRSQRILDLPLRDLRRAGYHVFVQDAEGIEGVCGDLARSQPPDTPTFE